MKLIGLTGGIGCGKTTVALEFQRIGVPCFIADDCARAYYDEPDFCASIGNAFGNDMLLADGHVDKVLLARKVFADKDALDRLNSIIHPRVMNDFSCWVSRQDAPYLIFESAIIFEHNLQRHLDKVIAVYLEKEERLRRLQLRDHADREQLEARMRNQLSAEEKMRRADYVILNYEGNPRQRQVATINKLILNEK